MLPVGNLRDLFFPMTADIYYASSTQNNFGDFDNTWYKDRTISCSAIKQSPNSDPRPVVSSEKFLEYGVRVNMRTNENIFKSTDGTHYTLDKILISNIKDPYGSITWMETDIKATSFEIENVEPIFDEVHNVMGYRVLLKRSDLQDDI